jgi:hypothetical protein
MPARKQKPTAKRKSTKRKSASRRKQRPVITGIKISGAFRVVADKRGHTLEIYQNKSEAVSAGVPDAIATELFSDVRVAWCWAHIDKQFKLIKCEKRSLDGETCAGECHLFADGEDVGTGEHIWDPNVTYRCRCIG